MLNGFERIFFISAYAYPNWRTKARGDCQQEYIIGCVYYMKKGYSIVDERYNEMRKHMKVDITGGQAQW